ncbi:MAG TPA: DUF1592 domain-containing protein, partial [Candidatus Latescibacteria bacterium]|nr:DUF1592 domain-containing protein [Candidatus Latescibacterota bacterium]
RVRLLAAAGIALMAGGLQAAGPQAQSATAAASRSPQRTLFNRYCLTCHNQTQSARGTVPVAFEHLDLANIGADAQIWEQVVRKMRAGVMPPAGRPRPDVRASEGFVSWLETELDAAAVARPNPGRIEAFHRLNRAEYRNAVRDLLHLDIDASDVSAWLPADDASYGFDNIAGVLRFSPTLMERYLVAAKQVSRLAVGMPPAFPNFDVFRLADDLPQDDRFEALPFGTRGGTLIHYNFPTAGEYTIRVKLARQVGTYDRNVPNFHQPQQLEVSVDGQRLEVFTLAASVPRELRQPGEPRRIDRATLDEEWVVRFQARAGSQEVMATFINRTPALLETLIEPYLRPHPSGGHNWGSRRGVYLRSVEISGPFPVGEMPAGSSASATAVADEAAGMSDTSSRRRIFVCRPVDPSQEARCAATIVSALARRAYRRPATDADVAGLLRFYEAGRADGGFESGIEMAVRRLLVSPEFLFRTKSDPANITPDTTYRVSDLELASRLSFFLWSSIPDDELLDLAARATLHQPAVLEQQVRRMLGDPRSHAIVDNFVGQWLLLRNLPALGPDPYKDPDFDESLRWALRRETELFFESIMREDRSVIDLLNADYTFLNERLARHYGMPFVHGDHFRRVTLPDSSVRGGLLGQGSILSVTSQPNRTSPVVRGKWILENILGVSPPAPPPDVPELDEPERVATAVTMRARMAAHRANPACASCHRMMDPLGLALENFDQAGRW